MAIAIEARRMLYLLSFVIDKALLCYQTMTSKNSKGKRCTDIENVLK